MEEDTHYWFWLFPDLVEDLTRTQTVPVHPLYQATS